MAKKGYKAGGSAELKGSAPSAIEFTPKVDDKPQVERGTCDNCKYNRYSVTTAVEKKGICEIGLSLRGHDHLPSENTCEAWLKRTV